MCVSPVLFGLTPETEGFCIFAVIDNADRQNSLSEKSDGK